jgi:hypothetical protein
MFRDDFFAANNLPPISLLKLDVEGYEAQALEGLRQVIWRDQSLWSYNMIAAPAPNHKKAPAYAICSIPTNLSLKWLPRSQFALKPFQSGNIEALVLPAELAGIIRGTHQR